MNKKGFTLVELLSVIVIIGIIATVATLAVTRYRATANEKEIKVLNQNIIAAFNNYRMTKLVSSNEEIKINELSFSSDLSYNGKKCSYSDESTIKYVIKKNVFDNNSSIRTILTKGVPSSVSTDIKTAYLDELFNSKEEVYCITFSCDSSELIDYDYKPIVEELAIGTDTNKEVIKIATINYCTGVEVK